MLLRVQAASLSSVKAYGERLKALNHKYFTVGTRLSFDPGEAYPKLVLEPTGSLNDDQAVIVKELRGSSAVQAILAEGSDLAQEPAPPSYSQVAPQATKVTPKVTPLPVKPTPTAGVMPSDGFGGPAPVKPPSRLNPKVVEKAQPAAPPPSQPLEQKPPASQ